MLDQVRGSGALARREQSYGPFDGTLTGVIRACFETLLVWQERSAQRRALASLDDRMLRDLGLSRADVALETAKPVWRP